MKLRGVFALLMLVMVAACGDDQAPPSQPDASRDQDSLPDLATQPDLDVIPDLATQPDLGDAPDLEDAPDMAPDMAQPLGAGLSRGLTISAIDAYQTVRVPLMGGEPQGERAPLIAGRETLVRVFVAPVAGAPAGPVTAEFIIEDGASAPLVLRDVKTLSAASTQPSLSSTFNAIIPRGKLTPTSRLSVRLTVEQGGDVLAQGASHTAAWPAERVGADLDARADGGKLRVMLVPLRYDYDGSGRLPELDSAQQMRFESLLRALFPSTDVEITVHDVISWDRSLRFGSINQMLVQLKEDEQADDDLYYYALIRPEETFEEYCGRSCTTGQSFTVSDSGDGIYRVGSGLGYANEERTWTLAHELGHMHGRGHAPCDVSFWNADGAYPYDDGEIGVWGWDARTGQLMDPQDNADMMGYCDDQWLSDYTYIGMFERAVRVAAQNALRQLRPARQARFVTVPAQGQPRWGERVRLRGGHTGELTRVRLIDSAGRALGQIEAPVIASDHFGARDVLIPALEREVAHIEVLGRRLSAADGR